MPERGRESRHPNDLDSMPQPPKSKKRQPKGFQIRASETGAEQTAESVPSKPRRSFEDLGELPHGYGSDTIFLVAQEPHRLFTYWDIDISRHPGGAAFLRVFAGDGTLETQIEVPFEVRNWYIPVASAGSEYHVEIGYFRGGDWNLVARSVPVTTPPEGLSPSDDFDFATVPFHLSFQRMVERVEAAARSGEDLLAALSRMQRGGDFSAFGPAAAILPSDPRTLLAGLLGPGFLDELASGGLSSSQIETAIRERVEELLSSGGASELSGSFAAAAFASQFGESSFSSESFASWAVAELAGPLASWSGASSWSSSLGAGGETSWFTGGSWLQALSGSWESGSLSSWTSSAGAVSSWLQAGQTSWAQAALSSWNSAGYSSWFAAAAAESSWSGASESLSSFGLERGFFMHVNAEVIFYGGTDPNARVTIDGVPVQLDARGNFRHHFVFPNADYEIPIVAESPDGVETRSATLRFHRATGKIGLVTDTTQPALGEPMGRLSQ